ncbi:uncharacterized protein LOC126136425 [Schistocerca cancellata]|uniref:uncharacterized protein LOC126136425 n=1 Tax=Schistocerca cancellata TaxID=274614 RepID=UPI002118F33D|nr:uncharacterized protein LOC126136425 [Schistocerca cancellata]
MKLTLLKVTMGDVAFKVLLPRKKQKSNDDRLIDVLQQSIPLREERERNQESDSDGLFLLSLLEDMKEIPEQRKLTTKLEITDVIKRAQMLPLRIHHQGYSNYASEPTVTGAYSRRYEPEASSRRQFQHGCVLQPNDGRADFRRGQKESRRDYSTLNTYRQDTAAEYDELSSLTDSTVSTQNSEILYLFHSSVLQQLKY